MAHKETDTGRRPITSEDLLALPVAGDPQMSPDGSQLAYTLTVVDREANAYRTHLWLVPTAGGEPRQLTTAKARETGPRWSPDGAHIAFMSDRGGDKQVCVIPVGGGEARVLTTGKLSPSDLAWAPDGRALAFVGKPPLPADQREDSDVRVISRVRYKADGEGFWDGRWKQIFVVPLAGGEARAVTQGDCDHLAPAWSPDGRSLAYTANPDPNADLTNVTDLWVVPADGKGTARRLTDGRGPVQSPVWSPDGARIAYVGHDNACWGASNWRVWIAPAAGGDVRCLTADTDCSVGHHIATDLRAHPSSGGITWAPDGCRLFFMLGDGGSTQIVSVPSDGGSVQRETQGEHELIGCSFDRRAARLACVESDALTPGEVAVGEIGSGQPLRRLTDHAGPLLRTLALAVPERFEFASVDGWTVEGWVLRPEAAKTGRVPAVLEIHGGPHAAYGNAFFHEMQLLAAQGYGVVYLNPRGSQGYGETFTAATRHDWGGKDYEDLMRGLDHALAAHPWIDPARLGVAGGSYGGFMTNWVIGHTDRFRAAVTMRSISNSASQWGTSDLAYMKGFWEYPGEPWEAPEFYRERSPITYAPRMKTPTLILHSENDYRCPMEQGEQLFMALKKQGVPTLFVRFPNESHDLSRNGQPKHRMERLRHILAWFRTYLAGDGAAGAAKAQGRVESVAADA
ncbi:MAG TPA: S9 family peptidase [bacterium]|nr:S9 family peptidase [bacterium]